MNWRLGRGDLGDPAHDDLVLNSLVHERSDHGGVDGARPRRALLRRIRLLAWLSEELNCRDNGDDHQQLALQSIDKTMTVIDAA
jgi:hypothetical protein